MDPGFRRGDGGAKACVAVLFFARGSFGAHARTLTSFAGLREGAPQGAARIRACLATLGTRTNMKAATRVLSSKTIGANAARPTKRRRAARPRPGTRKQPSPGQGAHAEVRPVRASAGNRSGESISGLNAPSPSEGPSNKRRERLKKPVSVK